MDTIQVGEYSIDAEISRKPGSKLNIVIAHGGNNNMNHSLIQKLFDAFVEKYSVLRFNFSFVKEGKATMNNVSKSEAELTACIKYIGADNVVLIGKSYGGYVSTLLAGRDDL
ncbi:dienelactone hydrolase, partial [mine drainage metagenome]